MLLTTQPVRHKPEQPKPATGTALDNPRDGNKITDSGVADNIADCLLGRWATGLLKDNVQNLIKQARQECAGQPKAAAAVEEALGYFVHNASRMLYGIFRAAGYFIGSGVVEAGCKTLIGSRCKQSGMFWSESGAENILALRCLHSSRRLEEFWKHRLNDQVAHNDTLALAT